MISIIASLLTILFLAIITFDQNITIDILSTYNRMLLAQNQRCGRYDQCPRMRDGYRANRCLKKSNDRYSECKCISEIDYMDTSDYLDTSPYFEWIDCDDIPAQTAIMNAIPTNQRCGRNNQCPRMRGGYKANLCLKESNDQYSECKCISYFDYIDTSDYTNPYPYSDWIDCDDIPAQITNRDTPSILQSTPVTHYGAIPEPIPKIGYNQQYDPEIMAEIMKAMPNLQRSALPKLEGWLEKKSPALLKGFQRRWVAVDRERKDMTMSWWSDKPESNANANGFIHLFTMTSVSPIGKSSDNTFMVKAWDNKKGKMRDYIFRSKTTQERDLWVIGLQQYERHCSLAKLYPDADS